MARPLSVMIVGMRHLDFVAHVLDVIDDVVGVFLQRVVDARFEIGLRAVVVDAQAAADVQVLQAGAGARQVHVDADRFVHRALDLADVGDLAAQVEVQQVEAVGHAERPSAPASARIASVTVRPNLER